MKLRWKKALMALAVFCGVNGLALTWGQAQAHSYVSERGLEWGRSLYEVATVLEDLSEGHGAELGHVQHLSVNGAQIRVHTGSVSAESVGIAGLVKRAQKSCRTPVSGEYSRGAAFEVPPLVWVGHDEAFVYCLKPSSKWTEESIREHLESFRETGDVTEWGRFQGAYFRRVGDRIAILSGEVLGGLDPEKMFPDEGDACGANISSLPAPPGRRLLSVAHERSVALTLHASDAEAEKSIDDYHLALIEAGHSVERAQAHTPTKALVVRNGPSAFVVTSRSVDSGSHLFVARLPQ